MGSATHDHAAEGFDLRGAVPADADDVAALLTQLGYPCEPADAGERIATVLHNDPANYESRAEVMWAGSLSHNGLTGCGSDGGDWATHMIEHELSGMFDVAHGAGLSAIWGSWARHVLSNRPDRFALFAERVMGVARAESDTATGLRGIEVMEDFFRSLDMPTSLKELDLAPTDAQLAEMAEKALVGKSHIGSVKKLLPPDIVAIFAASR